MFERTLLRFSDNPADRWTIDDAFKGVSILGGTGSGKTTASGKALAIEYLSQGWGGLVLCAKSDEAQLWRDYCKLAHRTQDLIIFGKNAVHSDGDHKGEKIVFNAIQYESERHGEGAGATLNLTNIFMNIYRMGNRISGEGDTKEERYWDNALKRCLNRIIELIKLAEEKLTYSNMVNLLSSTVTITEDKFDEENEFIKETNDFSRLDKPDLYCIKCLLKAYYTNFKQRKADEETENSYRLVYNYFLLDIPAMGEKMRSTITESFMGLAEPFLSGVLYSHFAGVTNIFPEWAYEKKKIIVLNFGIKEYLDAGILAQCVFKLLFQQAIERRDVSQHPLPVFLWADEAQYFINPYDQIFLTTARSSQTATVFLSQNISNYLAIMGSGDVSRSRVDSLMGNLSTKIFHANSDAATNEYASRLIGMDKDELPSVQYSEDAHFSLTQNKAKTLTTSFQSQVQAKEFTTLKSGGVNHDFTVEAIIMATGREWSDGKNFIRTEFTQEF